MIIDDFHVPGRALFPDEAHAPLVVHADTPLAFAVAFERFQPILRRNAQGLQAFDSMQHLQFPNRNAGDVGKSWGAFPLKQRLCFATFELFDHA